MSENALLDKAIQTTKFLEKHKDRKNPINYKSEKVPEAYGELVYAKTLKAFQNKETHIRTDALTQLTDLAWDDDNVYHAIATGVFDGCVDRLSDLEAVVRQCASAALEALTRSRTGRTHAVATDITPQLAAVLSDKDEIVRENVYAVFQNLGKDGEGLLVIIKAGLPEAFINRIGIESKPVLRSAAIDIIAKCCEDALGYDVAMSYNLVDAVYAALDDQSSEQVITACYKCFAVVAAKFDGQDACVNVGAVPLILEGLATPNTKLQAAAATALMNITICQQGKVAVVKSGGLPQLIAAVSHHEISVIAPCLQAIASTVEHPLGKKDLAVLDKGNIAFLEALSGHQSKLIARSAKLALEKIRWTP